MRKEVLAVGIDTSLLEREPHQRVKNDLKLGYLKKRADRLRGRATMSESSDGIIFKGVAASKAKAGYLSDGPQNAFSEKAAVVEIEGFARGGGKCIFRMKDDDGMAPTIEDGDHLLCTRLENTGEAYSGNIVVIQTASERIVKRVHFLDDKIVVQSDNPKYNIYKLDEREVDYIWRVERKLSMADMQNFDQKQDSLAYLEKDLSDLRTQLEELRSKLRER